MTVATSSRRENARRDGGLERGGSERGRSDRSRRAWPDVVRQAGRDRATAVPYLRLVTTPVEPDPASDERELPGPERFPDSNVPASRRSKDPVSAMPVGSAGAAMPVGSAGAATGSDPGPATARGAVMAVGPRDGHARRSAPVPARRSAPVPTRRPVRLTRRGRAVLWLLLLGVAITAMALLAPASQAASPSGPPRTVTVHAGDTMWSIASKALPREAPNVAVERIRLLNHLADNEVYAGEQLLLPAS